MGPDQGQGQLGDLVNEFFEAAMLLSPLFDLGEQIHRDVNGMGFGFELPSEVVAQVLAASSTAAVGIATGAADGDEAGGQDWAFGLELLLAGQKEAADQGGMFGCFHTFTGAVSRPRQLNSIKAYQLQEENRALRQLFERGLPPTAPTVGRPTRNPDGSKNSNGPKTRRLLRETHSGAPPANRGPWPRSSAASPPQGAKSSYVTGLAA